MPFTNPIIPGFHPDPSLCRVGADYYLVTSSFEYFPGVPLFHSRDLVNWRQLGHVLTRSSQLPLERCRTSGGIYAPTIRHADGRFWMITTNTHVHRQILVNAVRPEGPWSDPVELDLGTIDPSLLFDDDGAIYVQATSNHGVVQRQLDPLTGTWLSEERTLWAGAGWQYVEAPHLYHIGEWYYLLCAEGGTEYGHCVTIARSPTPWGPFTSCPQNPILTHRGRRSPIQATGHADLFEDHHGAWWLVCLGIRPLPIYPNGHNLGRETFLAPVSWVDGWPVVNGGQLLSLDMETPTLPLHPWPAATEREAFVGDTLPPHWNVLRNPLPGAWALGERSGYLRLRATRATIDENDAPAWIGRRQQHHACRFSAALEIGGDAGGEAGLTVFANEQHHDDLTVTCVAGRRVLRLRRRTGSLAAVVAERDIADGPLILAIVATSQRYALGIIAADGSFDVLGEAETLYRCTEVAGGFTGVYFALFAQRGAILDAAWVEYRPC